MTEHSGYWDISTNLSKQHTIKREQIIYPSPQNVEGYSQYKAYTTDHANFKDLSSACIRLQYSLHKYQDVNGNDVMKGTAGAVKVPVENADLAHVTGSALHLLKSVTLYLNDVQYDEEMVDPSYIEQAILNRDSRGSYLDVVARTEDYHIENAANPVADRYAPLLNYGKRYVYIPLWHLYPSLRTLSYSRVKIDVEAIKNDAPLALKANANLLGLEFDIHSFDVVCDRVEPSDAMKKQFMESRAKNPITKHSIESLNAYQYNYPTVSAGRHQWVIQTKKNRRLRSIILFFKENTVAADINNTHNMDPERLGELYLRVNGKQMPVYRFNSATDLNRIIHCGLKIGGKAYECEEATKAYEKATFQYNAVYNFDLTMDNGKYDANEINTIEVNWALPAAVNNNYTVHALFQTERLLELNNSENLTTFKLL